MIGDVVLSEESLHSSFSLSFDEPSTDRLPYDRTSLPLA